MCIFFKAKNMSDFLKSLLAMISVWVGTCIICINYLMHTRDMLVCVLCVLYVYVCVVCVHTCVCCVCAYVCAATCMCVISPQCLQGKIDLFTIDCKYYINCLVNIRASCFGYFHSDYQHHPCNAVVNYKSDHCSCGS